MISPTIQALDIESLDAFWQSLTIHKTPLIEPIPEDSKHLLVTFIWRGDAQTERVSVVKCVFGFDFSAGQLQRFKHTELWYRSVKVPRNLHIGYRFAINPPLVQVGTPEWAQVVRTADYRTDPFNPPPAGFADSYIRLVGAPSEAWLIQHPSRKKGQLHEFFIEHEANGQSYQVRVYEPPVVADKLTCMVLLNGTMYTPEACHMLANFIAKNKIPPTLGVFIDEINAPFQIDDLNEHTDYIDFVGKTLPKWLHENYLLTVDPRQVVLGGASSEGLVAAYTAFLFPEIYGNVLVQGGRFAWMPYQNGIVPSNPFDENLGWFIQKVAQSERKSLRWHLDVGIYDHDGVASLYTNNLLFNRHLRDVLLAKGYRVDYVEFAGGHDDIGWRTALPRALLSLIGQ